MKIGIYPGSFNPIHTTHINIAETLISKNFVNKVIFVPAGDNYEKDDLIEGIHRINMVNLAIKNHSNLLTSDIEVQNKQLYTYQTLDYFKNLHKTDEIYLIMGTDNLKELYWWKRNEYILSEYKIIVIARNK